MTGPEHDVQAQVEAILDVLAPRAVLPPGFTSAPGVQDIRVPRILVDYDGTPVWPTDDQLRSLAEQIVTAVRTASGDVR